MDIAALSTPGFIRSIMFGVSVCCAILYFGWPYLERSQFQIRVLKLQEDRKTRLDKEMRERDNPVDISTPIWSRVLKFVANLSEFVKFTSNDEIARLLRLGGYRSKNAMTNFQAIRVISPVVVFFILLIYVKMIFKVDLPITFLAFILFLPSSLGFYIPVLYVKNRALRRKQAIVHAWPDALDLLLIAVEAGMSTEAAFRKTANDMIRYSKDIAEELTITTAELSYLHDRKQAFANLAERTGSSEIRATTTALIQAERYGTSLGSSLRILAEESRNLRMREVERKAAALSPKLTIPMVIFFMPVLISILIVPSLIRVWGWS